MSKKNNAGVPVPGGEPGPGKLDLGIFEAALRQPISPVPDFDPKNIGAAVAKGEGHHESVRTHHERLFASTAGSERPLLVKLHRVASGHVDSLTAHIATLKRRALRTDKYRDEIVLGPPWTNFEVVQVGIYTIVSAAMLYVGWQALATVLQESGIEAFEDRTRAQTFSLIPIAASFVWEALASCIGTDAARRRYIASVYISAIALGSVWVYLFVQTFGDGIAVSSGEFVWDLVEDGSTDSGGSGRALLIVGVLAEMAIAASCWLTIAGVVQQHGHSKPVPNPHYTVLEREMGHYKRDLVRAQGIVAKLHTRIEQIKNACDVFVRGALDVYDLAIARTKNTAIVVNDLTKMRPLQLPDRLLPNQNGLDWVI